jgi:hypothetical protein
VDHSSHDDGFLSIGNKKFLWTCRHATVYLLETKNLCGPVITWWGWTLSNKNSCVLSVIKWWGQTLLNQKCLWTCDHVRAVLYLVLGENSCGSIIAWWGCMFW